MVDFQIRFSSTFMYKSKRWINTVAATFLKPRLHDTTGCIV